MLFSSRQKYKKQGEVQIKFYPEFLRGNKKEVRKVLVRVPLKPSWF